MQKPTFEQTEWRHHIEKEGMYSGVLMKLKACESLLVARLEVPEKLKDDTEHLDQIAISAKKSLLQMARAIRDELNSLDLDDDSPNLPS